MKYLNRPKSNNIKTKLQPTLSLEAQHYYCTSTVITATMLPSTFPLSGCLLTGLIQRLTERLYTINGPWACTVQQIGIQGIDVALGDCGYLWPLLPVNAVDIALILAA